MARYTALTKPDDSGEQAPIAKLELDGYTNNEFWDGEGSVNEFWPYTAVGALIYLFTGRRPEDDKEGAGVEIPDSLGWHIALLMDFWCDLWGSLSEEGGGLGTDSNNSLREYLAYQTAQGAYPSRAAVGYAEMSANYRHSQYRQRVVQQWYSDGIRLYQSTQ